MKFSMGNYQNLLVCRSYKFYIRVYNTNLQQNNFWLIKVESEMAEREFTKTSISS